VSYTYLIIVAKFQINSGIIFEVIIIKKSFMLPAQVRLMSSYGT